MKIAVTNPSPEVAVVAFQHDSLDASNVKAFREAITPVILANRVLVLDMSGLKFVDSSGLGALLSCLRNMNSKGGELRLSGMAPAVLALFELVRMHRIFAIYNSTGEALEASAST